MNMVRKFYRVAGALSLAMLVLQTAGVGVLWFTGHLDADRLAKVRSALGGQAEDMEAAGKSGQPVDAASGGSQESNTSRQINDDIAWRNHLRRLAELDQRKAALQLEMIRVEKKREAVDHEEELLQKQQRARQEIDQLQGFQKELELLGQMKPKQALDLLLAKAPEDAAHLLFKLDARTTKKVVEAARSDSDKAKLRQILNLMRDLDGQRSAETAASAS